MEVTTGGISVGVGVLIVGTLAVAGVMTVRDENNGGSASPACVSQSRADAGQAQEEFMSRFVEPDPEAETNAWFVGVGLSNRVAANDAIESSEEVGFPASEPLPSAVGEDLVLLVLYDHTKDVPELPSCIEDTPVAYVGTGGPAQLD